LTLVSGNQRETLCVGETSTVEKRIVSFILREFFFLEE